MRGLVPSDATFLLQYEPKRSIRGSGRALLASLEVWLKNKYVQAFAVGAFSPPAQESNTLEQPFR